MNRQHHGMDTDTQVFFYPCEFYCLANFAAFSVNWHGWNFQTAEHAYQSAKFAGVNEEITEDIFLANSAHEAFQLAQEYREKIRADWMLVRLGIMKEILIAKTKQHEYVRRKLLQTGDREIIEDSWHDDFWGWGPNKDGQNMLGKLWMEVREEVRRWPVDKESNKCESS